MTEPQRTPTTVSTIGVAMFSVSDQDKAIAFYTQKLGYEVRSDMRFGENGEMRWVEVAPPGSQARLALNPPMGGSPGGGVGRHPGVQWHGRAHPLAVGAVGRRLPTGPAARPRLQDQSVRVFAIKSRASHTTIHGPRMDGAYVA